MNPETWWIQLRNQLDNVLNDNISEAQFSILVKELARDPNLSCGSNLHPNALLSMILAGAVSSGEIEEVASILAGFCCNGSTGFNIDIIKSMTGRDDIGPALHEF